MSEHLKRFKAPDSWHISKKTNKFITKTAPGPHNANALPVAVWLRDQMGLARNMKEVKQILHQRDVIVNGRACRDPKMGIGIFDIVSLPKINKYYRILRDKNGRHKTIEIDIEAAKTRLCKISNKTVVSDGKIQSTCVTARTFSGTIPTSQRIQLSSQLTRRAGLKLLTTSPMPLATWQW